MIDVSGGLITTATFTRPHPSAGYLNAGGAWEFDASGVTGVSFNGATLAQFITTTDKGSFTAKGITFKNFAGQFS